MKTNFIIIKLNVKLHLISTFYRLFVLLFKKKFDYDLDVDDNRCVYIRIFYQSIE